ncbi:hypothetical protein LTR94_031135 [Friedmanniomyces endolithicus]|nr:hypothetical protein LTR94_031135 [Friedmanniomyces endolithicus]
MTRPPLFLLVRASARPHADHQQQHRHRLKDDAQPHQLVRADARAFPALVQVVEAEAQGDDDAGHGDQD